MHIVAKVKWNYLWIKFPGLKDGKLEHMLVSYTRSIRSLSYHVTYLDPISENLLRPIGQPRAAQATEI